MFRSTGSSKFPKATRLNLLHCSTESLSLSIRATLSLAFPCYYQSIPCHPQWSLHQMIQTSILHNSLHSRVQDSAWAMRWSNSSPMAWDLGLGTAPTLGKLMPTIDKSHKTNSKCLDSKNETINGIATSLPLALSNWWLRKFQRQDHEIILDKWHCYIVINQASKDI